MKATIETFEREPHRYIWVDKGGGIVVESRFICEFDGNIGRLLGCCNDWIYEEVDGLKTTEKINYNKAIRDYMKKSINKKWQMAPRPTCILEKNTKCHRSHCLVVAGNDKLEVCPYYMVFAEMEVK